MKKFRAVAATTEPCLNNSQPAKTLEDLQKFDGHEEAVLLDFDNEKPIARVQKAWIEDNKLHVEGVVDKWYAGMGLYVVVSYRVDSKTKVMVEPMQYGLTTAPADTGVTPMEVVEE